MGMIEGLTIALTLTLLWVSHRTFKAYVRAVFREERRRPGRPARHLGPKLFLTLDLVLLAILCETLRPLLGGHGEWHAVVRTYTVFSAIFAGWMLLEGRHLLVFYQHLARASRGLGPKRRLAWQDRLLGSTRRRTLIGLALAAAAAPAAVWLVDPGSLEKGTLNLALWFAACFLGPQILLGAAVARAVLPVRELAYDA